MQMPKPPGSGKSPMVDPKSAPIAHVLTICVARSNPIGVPLGAVSARKALRATGGVLIFFGVVYGVSNSSFTTVFANQQLTSSFLLRCWLRSRSFLRGFLLLFLFCHW